ncbi:MULTISPECIES: ABC transporter substrate-binding protein [unclassified Streptomyces]|uniref:ABC transporter substrate-binding protein n=1 Tax=unclassified Streptomyces TaxID=2593676 RepID=UPI0003610394|nr:MULTISPECIES: ABC transporter substrate-binding protein [unclassified Streptomyces]MYX38375.1 ABC transporter substrate-binding protein [Streptomyces sp. SID8377]
MRRSHRQGLRLRGGAALAVLALVLTACSGGSGGGSAAPGVTEDSIVIGSHQPLTGPAAPGYSNVSAGAKAYFDHVNAGGGVNGRKIDFRYKDDAYNPTQTVKVTKELVLEDKIFAMMGGLGTPTHTKVVDYLNSRRVPDLFVSSGCRCWDQPDKHPQTFGWQPDYLVEGKILGQYIKENFAGKKVAYFYQGDDFGKDGVEGLDQYVPKESVVSRQSYQPGGTDIAPQVTAIAQSKADVVVLFTIPTYTALFKLTSLKLRYNPQMVVTNVGSDPTTLAGLLQSFAKQAGGTADPAALMDGIITDTYMPPTNDASNSWIKLFRGIHDKYIPKLPFDGNVEFGMSMAYTFVQALQGAGKNPTRESLVKAVEKGGFTGPGLVPFRFSGDSHAGYTGVQIGILKGSTEVALQGTPLVTDSERGAITPYTTAQPQAPADGIPAP